MADQSKQSKGGEERARSLTGEQRKEIARQAAEARWGKNLLQATHDGVLKIDDRELLAAVLPNGKRLLSQGTFLQAIGRSRTPKAGTGGLTTVDGTPFFLQAEALKPFISDQLMMSTTPIFFRLKDGAKTVGYDAELLPMVAEVYLKLRDDCLSNGRPIPLHFKHIIKACDILMRGLARVGIIALVDEATGYQYDRPRQALAEILEKFISKSLCAWAKTFENDYYRELFRLRKWTYTSFSTKRPILAAKLTVNIVYQRLAPAVLDELRRLNPQDEHGRRKHKLFQHLTPDLGHPKLKEHLAAVTALMRASDTWQDFMHILNRALPPYLPMPLFEQHEAEAKENAAVAIGSASKTPTHE